MPLLLEHFALLVLAHLFAALLDYATHILPFVSQLMECSIIFTNVKKARKGEFSECGGLTPLSPAGA